MYYDTERLGLYTRRFHRLNGATLVRVRWYGADWGMSRVFLERKVHKQRAPSVKERASVPADAAFALVDGEAPAPEKALAREILGRIGPAGDLAPSLRIVYNRVAYASPDNDAMRLSLDNNVRFETVQPPSRIPRAGEAGVDRAYHLPFAVLEVKLSGLVTQSPPWVVAMIKRGLISVAFRFSKYLHGLSRTRAAELDYLSLDFPRELRRAPQTLAVAVGADDEEDELTSMFQRNLAVPAAIEVPPLTPTSTKKTDLDSLRRRALRKAVRQRPGEPRPLRRASSTELRKSPKSDTLA